jgi:hypothetical protein
MNPMPTPPLDPITDEQEAPDSTEQSLISQFKAGIDLCKTYRRKLIATWTVNIDYRRGKPFTSQTDEDRIAINLDWSLTKAKQATLFSQVPQVRIDHPPQSLGAGPWVATFERRLNDLLVKGGIESAMYECLPDVINAAGIGAILVAHEAITEDVVVPTIDITTMPPEVGAIIMQTGKMPDGSEIPTTVVPRVVDHRYTISRVSPADLLWPINFTGSDWDRSPWRGRSGRVTWPVALKRFKLTEADKPVILGEERTSVDRLTHDVDKDKTPSEELVGFDEIFVNEYEFNPDAKSFGAIRHLVFVNGKDKPVINEIWKGQQVGSDNLITGAQKSPLRILTLSYVSDETIPPSDSAIGRPQINEINKGRTQMVLQRDRSIPIRWFDVNRVDPTIGQALMRGTWQHMIPVQGQGTNIIGEVQRSNMPPENFTFDKVAKADLNEAWSIGPNQDDSGSGIETKAEANIVQSNFQTRVSQERARVAAFVVGIAEVLGGLMCLYEDPASFGQGFTPDISRTLGFSILVDSTVMLDSNQRLQKLVQFVNFTAKSGWINIEAVLKEIATLSGLDPNTVIQPPQPKPPVEPNISLRLTGAADLMNPLALATFIKSGQAPPPELLDQAMALIAKAVTPPQSAPPNMPILPGTLPNLTMEQFKGVPPPTPGGPIPAPPEPAAGVPPPPPPRVGEANPQWSAMPKVNKRSESEGGA